jgi:hypothetical protein
VFGRAVYDPASCGSGHLDRGTTSGPWLMPGCHPGEPHPAESQWGQLSRRDPQRRGRAGPALRGRSRLARPRRMN